MDDRLAQCAACQQAGTHSAQNADEKARKRPPPLMGARDAGSWQHLQQGQERALNMAACSSEAAAGSAVSAGGRDAWPLPLCGLVRAWSTRGCTSLSQSPCMQQPGGTPPVCACMDQAAAACEG